MTTANGKNARQAATTAPVGYAYMVIAFLEAVTWAGLLVGMYQKHVLGLEQNLVPLFGGLHGLVFMLYIGITIVTARMLTWSLRTTIITLAAGVPPFVTIPVELWLRRTGRLALRPDQKEPLDTPAAS